MGREVRRVPADWEHPRNKTGEYQPKHDQSYRDAVAEWKDGYAHWERGQVRDFDTGGWRERDLTKSYEQGEFWDYDGAPPDDEDYYRPGWPEETRTHLQMYETCSEGTPLSPPMPDAESLARWLADNGASAFAGMTATYEQWLATIHAGSCFSAVITAGGEMKSGVEHMAKLEKS